MHLAVTLCALVASVLAVTALSRRFDLPGPLVLIAVGIVASYLPFIPDVHLSAEVVLVGLLPPLLYAAALQTSLVDFYANKNVILLLSIGLVIFTTLGVGVVVHWLLPDLAWAACFAIGAVVAPPDAVAATAIGRRIGLPRRIVTILEGESLLNDATALVALQTAIAATVAWQEVSLRFAVAAGGGVLVGLVTFVVVGKVRRHVTDPLLDSGLSFLTPFAAYVAAEELHVAEGMHGSGVLAVVIAGLLLGHRAPILQSAQSRIAERTNWRSIAFLLEGAVFLLIGLQARGIVQAVGGGEVGYGRVAAVCGMTLLAVIVLRCVWVLGARTLLLRPRGEAGGTSGPPLTYTLLLGWAGMRGVVTLAAAFVIPEETPHRDVLLLIAFTVTAGTLFLQGLSLPWVARALRVPSPDAAADALARANLLHQASQAGLALLDRTTEEDPHGILEMIRERVRRRDYAAWERIGGSSVETPSEAYARWRRQMIDAERGRVLQIRSTGAVPHEVVEEVLAMLDVEESMLDHSERTQQRLHAQAGHADEGACEHLRHGYPPVEPGTPEGCEECLAIGSGWVHLRMCLTCGHVGCCDSSPHQHATKHFDETKHPVVRSFESGESWRWCFVDEVTG